MQGWGKTDLESSATILQKTNVKPSFENFVILSLKQYAKMCVLGFHSQWGNLHSTFYQRHISL